MNYMTNENSQLKKGILCIVVTTIAFSTMEITGKMISGDLNPFQLTFIRFFIGGIFLLPFALREMHKRKTMLGTKDFLFFTLTGILGIVISMSFFQSAVLYTKASVVAVIFSTNPIFTAPLAALILKEKLSLTKISSLFISIIGVILIFNPFSSNPDFKGMLLALLAAVSFSLYSVISKTKVEKYGGLILNCFSFLIGDGILLFVILWLGKPVIAGISLQNLAPLIYLGIFVTGIGYLCYFTAMKYTSAITASTVFFIKPALASILSVIILKESISFNTIIGCLLIIVASLIMINQNRVKLESIKL